MVCRRAECRHPAEINCAAGTKHEPSAGGRPAQRRPPVSSWGGGGSEATALPGICQRPRPQQGPPAKKAFVASGTRCSEVHFSEPLHFLRDTGIRFQTEPWWLLRVPTVMEERHKNSQFSFCDRDAIYCWNVKETQRCTAMRTALKVLDVHTEAKQTQTPVQLFAERLSAERKKHPG